MGNLRNMEESLMDLPKDMVEVPTYGW